MALLSFLLFAALGLSTARSLDHANSWSETTWNGWGGSISNLRWAESSALNTSSVKTLTPHCQLKYDKGQSAAPSISGDIAYYPTWSGQLVALNYKTCETIWETNITKTVVEFKPVSANQNLLALPVSRTTPFLDCGILYLGTQVHALFLAVNATDGTLLALKQISTHPYAVITQSPSVYKGRVLIGVSSVEETAAAKIPNYQCCSFAGSMMALTFDHTKGSFDIAWEVSMLPTPQGGWSGNAVWGSQPSIDEARQQVFIATGNVYKAPKKYAACAESVEAGNKTSSCLPKRVYQESVLSIDIERGHVNWVRPLSALDAWTVACLPGAAPGNKKKNCPAAPGSDADFGMAPSFVSASSAQTPNGKDALVVGQKNGNLYAISPVDGSVLWSVNTSPDGVDGGLSWGVAVDDSQVYFTALDWNQVSWKLRPSGREIHNSAWGAANLTDGGFTWETQVPGSISLSQVPPTVADGVVISGRTSFNETGELAKKGGELVMLDAANGNILNSMPLDSPFHGGIAVQDEYLLFGTGYSSGTEKGSFYVVKVG